MISTQARATAVGGFGVAVSPADVRVWLEAEDGFCEYDVYPSVENAVVSVRTSRSCYATVYLVDTAGYVHVIYPLSPYDNTYFRGGSVYRFYLRDFGFDPLFGRGVAYAFAVTSPVRFTYARYGWGVFGAGFGYRVCGDPYVAARSFYISILSDQCRAEAVGVGHARFFVKEYVRYPSYLCDASHARDGYCRADCGVHKRYAVHAADPYRVLNPTVRVADSEPARTQIIRSDRWDDARARHEKTVTGKTGEPVAYQGRGRSKSEQVREVDDNNVRRPTVISSKNTFVQGKKDIIAMRRQFEQKDTRKDTAKADAGAKKLSKKTQQVARAEHSSRNVTKTSAGGRKDSAEKERHGSR
jgi:hypothetical protein